LVSATAGAWAWDYLMSIIEEYCMFSTRKLSIPDLCYALSRLTTLGFLTTILVFLNGPVSDCQKLVNISVLFGVIAMPISSILIFFRTYAVFHDSHLSVKIFFGLLWLSTLGSITAYNSLTAVEIGNTGVCVNLTVKPILASVFIIVAVHDTIASFAISVKLALGSMDDSVRSTTSLFSTVFRGRGMGQISRAVLTGSQRYYFATTGVNILAMVAVLIPSVPVHYHVMFAVPNVAIQNAMACRVYRQLKLGILVDPPSIPRTSRTAVQGSRQETEISLPLKDIHRVGVDGHARYEMGTIQVYRGRETREEAQKGPQEPEDLGPAIGLVEKPGALEVSVHKDYYITSPC